MTAYQVRVLDLAVRDLTRLDKPVGRRIVKRIYWLEQQPSSIPSVYSTLREDLYVILTNLESDGSATFKFLVNPLVSWIWAGGYVFTLGTIVCFLPERWGRRRRAKPLEAGA